MRMEQAGQFPACKQCGEGDLVPLSDYGGQGASILYKAWVCTNPGCGYNLKIRNGELVLNEPISSGEPSQRGPGRGRPPGVHPLR